MKPFKVKIELEQTEDGCLVVRAEGTGIALTAKFDQGTEIMRTAISLLRGLLKLGTE